ncbi:MAG: hypothetical protein E6J72_14785, partial [Deltaproteobacteria bacterium]
MNRAPLRAAGVASLVVLALVIPTYASALTSAELNCLDTIGSSGARFAERVHAALHACDEAIVVGNTCDTQQRDSVIALAASRLGKDLAAACSQVDLTHLGFPGPCTDPDGGSFSVDNLTSCLVDAGEAQMTTAEDTEFPNPHPLSKPDAKCQVGIANATQDFITSKLQARSNCLDEQAAGTISASIDCRAEVPPGTGDPQTDQAIAQAQANLAANLQQACGKTQLEHLGFPGSCSDPDGGSFSVGNLQDCLLTTLENAVDTFINFEYPPPGGPTPTPGSTATATPVVTATAQPTTTATATAQPTATLTAVRTATATTTPN